MSTFDELTVGTVFTTPARALTDPDVDTLVRIGGYIHPLFHDGRRLMPGEAVLHVMGGLAEASGRFDDTVIALAGFEDVAFRAPAFAGDELHCEIEVLDAAERGSRGTLVMAWRCLNAAGDLICEARARMLFRI